MLTALCPCTGLTKRYGDRTVVDGLDLELPPVSSPGFVGPNGAGKTTTMAMLLGLVRPTAGTGDRARSSASTDPAAYLPRVGALIESPAFYPSLSRSREPADVRQRRRPRLERDPRSARHSSGWPSAATTATAPTRSA